MDQIIINYLVIFVIPMAVGVALRLLFLRKEKGYIVTAVLAVLTAIAWIAAAVIPNHGSELYGIIALRVSSIAVASLITGGILRLVKKKQ